VRELLINVAKHAKCDSASINAHIRNSEIVIEISDAGAGFDPASPPPPTRKRGMGLKSVRERLSLIGGTMTIDARPGAGTTVVLTAPLDPRGSADTSL
jgi:two-component system sensor histidine kinase UhpB